MESSDAVPPHTISCDELRSHTQRWSLRGSGITPDMGADVHVNVDRDSSYSSFVSLPASLPPKRKMRLPAASTASGAPERADGTVPDWTGLLHAGVPALRSSAYRSFVSVEPVLSSPPRTNSLPDVGS